jgi:hypothetical protein
MRAVLASTRRHGVDWMTSRAACQQCSTCRSLARLNSEETGMTTFGRMTRGAWQPENGGVPVVEFRRRGGPLTFTARDQTDFVEAFYRSAASAPSAPRAHGRFELSVRASSGRRGFTVPDAGSRGRRSRGAARTDREMVRVQRLPIDRDRRAGSMRRPLRTPAGLAAFRRTLWSRSRAEQN